MGKTLLALFNRNATTLSSFPVPSPITPHLPILLSMKNPYFIDVNTHLTSIIGGSSPPFPFSSANEYYEWASADKSLASIRIPFLAINAIDDPIVAEVPLHEAGKNPLVAIVLTRRGGHLGWFTGGGLAGYGARVGRWYVTPVCEWLEATVEDFVDGRSRRGKACVETSDGFTVEEGSGGLVGYKVKEVGIKIQTAMTSPGAIQGL